MARTKIYPIKSYAIVDNEELQQDDSIVIGFKYATTKDSTGEIFLQSRLPAMIDRLNEVLDDLRAIDAKRRS